MTQTQRPPTLIPSVIAPPVQTSKPSSQGFSARLWQRFTTLRGRFTMLLIAVLVVTCLTALAVALSSSRAASDLNAIGTESIPSVSAAQNIVPYLEDIDAHAADYLGDTNPALFSCVDNLTGAQLGQLSAHDCADKIIASDQLAINHQLFLAGQNVAFPGSRTALEQTQNGLETYIGDINLMRSYYNQAANHSNPNDPQMQLAYQASRSAQTILLQQLPGRVTNESNLPSCQGISPQAWPNDGIETNMLCLSALGEQQEQKAYGDTINFFGISLGIVFGLSIYCCIFLLWSSWSMITVTRKIFNPGLILALLVALFSTTAVLADFDAIYGDNGYFTVINTAYTNTYNAGTLAQKSSQVQADQARWLEALSFGDFNIANQWKQDEQTADQQVTADLQSKQYAALPTNIQQDWNQYNTQIGQVAQLANSATTPGSLSEAETQHIGPASSAFRTLIGDIQNYNNSNVSNYQNLLTQAGNSMALLTTVWAIIFPVLGVVGAWGISRRLKDF